MSQAPPPPVRSSNPSIVADIGAGSSRWGSSGNPSPSLVLAHELSEQYVPKDAGGLPKGDRLRRPYGYVDAAGLSFDAEALQACIARGLADVGRSSESRGSSSSAATPPERAVTPNSLLLVSPSQATADMRRKMTEILFETTQLQRAFVAKRAALGAYAWGQTSALVLDVGASHSCASAVLEGWVVPDRCWDCPIGGDYLDSALLNKVGGTTAPRICNVDTPSLVDRLELVRKLKEGACQGAAPDTQETKTTLQRTEPAGQQRDILLPDGTRVSLNGQADVLRTLPELLFQAPSTLSGLAGLAAGFVPGELSAMCPISGAREKYRGLQWLLAGCAGEVSEGVPIQAAALQKVSRRVVLIGGTARMPRLAQRFQAELGRRGRADDLRVLAPDSAVGTATPLAEHSAWVGGSLVASLGSFEDFWMTRAEYEEVGSKLVEDKCP
eukprot:TRINITY_DN80441_c0_g1_i1.p1 TRINITY_DN80441_c0_g1~~TRINITY_DN80441_c0_g1_i1.p1  ORF type:complete len:441 (+),score=72.19 TRINITY_DN80441_c0_g1_i1:63-1385(+)